MSASASGFQCQRRVREKKRHRERTKTYARRQRDDDEPLVGEVERVLHGQHVQRGLGDLVRGRRRVRVARRQRHRAHGGGDVDDLLARAGTE